MCLGWEECRGWYGPLGGVCACILNCWMSPAPLWINYRNKTDGIEGTSATLYSISCLSYAAFSVSLLPLAVYPSFFQNGLSLSHPLSSTSLSFVNNEQQTSLSFPFLLGHDLMKQLHDMFNLWPTTPLSGLLYALYGFLFFFVWINFFKIRDLTKNCQLLLQHPKQFFAD